jgi:hypothetical protein
MSSRPQYFSSGHGTAFSCPLSLLSEGLKGVIPASGEINVMSPFDFTKHLFWLEFRAVSVLMFDRELDQTHVEIDALFESTCHGLFLRSISPDTRFSEYLDARLFAVMNSFFGAEAYHVFNAFHNFHDRFFANALKSSSVLHAVGVFSRRIFRNG